MPRFIIQLFFLFLVSTNIVLAQSTGITADFRNQTISGVLQLLKDKYAYPEITAKMEEAIQTRQKRGEYDAIKDGNQFAEKLTADLRAVFDDKHLKLSYSEKPFSAQSSKAGAPTAAEIEEARRKQTRENFGVQKVEILKGNVGLIQLNYFAPLDWSSETLSAAMNYVANTDALIIDVRRNGGSMDINAIPFFCSYLFDKPVQVGDIYSRETKETRQLWTYAQVPGRKYLDKPVYILTSNKTASGAEGFVQHLKRLKRATIIGETTRGATMPGMSHRVNEHFSIWISTGRSANGSAQNENKGVQPDIEATADKALNAAHLEALNQLLQNGKDEEWKAEIRKIAAGVEQK